MLAGIAVRISTRALIYTGYLATCLAAACSSAPTPGANAPDSPVNITDLQNVSVDAPTFEVGDQVNFVSEAGVTERTVIVATGHGRTYRVVEADGDIWIQHYDENSNRFLSEREDGSKKIEVVPSTIKYEFPLFVGKSWSGSFFTTVSESDGDQNKIVERYSTDVGCEVLCIEGFEAPAGRFETFKISCDLDRSDRNVGERQIYWYSPAIGSNMRNEFRTDAGRLYDWYGMYSYSRAHTVAFDALPEGVGSTCPEND